MKVIFGNQIYSQDILIIVFQNNEFIAQTEQVCYSMSDNKTESSKQQVNASPHNIAWYSFDLTDVLIIKLARKVKTDTTGRFVAQIL